MLTLNVYYATEMYHCRSRSWIFGRITELILTEESIFGLILKVDVSALTNGWSVRQCKSQHIIIRAWLLFMGTVENKCFFTSSQSNIHQPQKLTQTVRRQKTAPVCRRWLHSHILSGSAANKVQHKETYLGQKPNIWSLKFENNIKVYTIYFNWYFVFISMPFVSSERNITI